MAPPREVDINMLRPLPRRQRRSERGESADNNDKPKFTDRHFWGMGKWGKRAGEWGKGTGPRMGGPNPWWTFTKVRIARALGLDQEPDPLSATPPLRVKIDNLFSSVKTMKSTRRGRADSDDDERSARS